MNRIITFEIYGENFSPKKLGFNFKSQNERGEIDSNKSSKQFKGKRMNYGSATYVVPKNIKDKFEHLADLFEPMLPIMEKAGATEWHIYIGRLYYGQCNEELDFHDIQNIARLKCSVAYSAFEVKSEEEELDGFNYEQYC